jgi:hypothetical protein
MTLNVFWPMDVTLKSGLIYGWKEESCWIVCTVGPLVGLQQKLVLFGTLNGNGSLAVDSLAVDMQLATIDGIPRIKHNYTGRNIQIILYHRPQSYLQFLSIQELDLDLLSRNLNLKMSEKVEAHVKYPDFPLKAPQIVLDLVIQLRNSRSIQVNILKKSYFLLYTRVQCSFCSRCCKK